MRGLLRLRAALAAFGVSLLASAAAAEPGLAGRTLIVGTYEDPPFSMQDETGRWQGLAIELWHEVADELEVEYELRGVEPPASVFEAVAQGRVDLVAAAVPITAGHLDQVEFTMPFLSKVFAIATLPAEPQGLLEEIGLHLSPRLAYTILAILALFAISTLCIWALERRRNPEHFGGRPSRGLGEALWWTAATVTTVGYGDRTPVTLAGRLLAVLVMFAALVLVSFFTGIVASQLTVRQLHGRIQGLSDLSRARVGIMAGTPMEAFLTDRGILYGTFPDIEKALEALVAGRLDAVVAGEPELQYYAERTFTGRISIVPGALDQGFLAFVVPDGSPLRHATNKALVRVLESPAWPLLSAEYLHR